MRLLNALTTSGRYALVFVAIVLGFVSYCVLVPVLAPCFLVANRMAEPARPLWQEFLIGLGEGVLFWVIVFPAAFLGWLVFQLVGPIWALPAAIAGTPLWCLIVGIPRAASGSKLANSGFLLTLVSNGCCVVVAVSRILLNVCTTL